MATGDGFGDFASFLTILQNMSQSSLPTATMATIIHISTGAMLSLLAWQRLPLQEGAGKAEEHSCGKYTGDTPPALSPTVSLFVAPGGPKSPCSGCPTHTVFQVIHACQFEGRCVPSQVCIMP